jgi:hypothetical protein
MLKILQSLESFTEMVRNDFVGADDLLVGRAD